MDDVAHVEIRRSGKRNWPRLGLGVAGVVTGAAVGLVWSENEGVTALLAAAAVMIVAGLAAVLSVACRPVDRSIRLTLTGEGMYLFGRRRPVRWADVRGARLLITKTRLGLLHPVLNLLVDRDGALKTMYVNLTELELTPQAITELVRERVRQAQADPDAALPSPPGDPTVQTAVAPVLTPSP